MTKLDDVATNAAAIDLEATSLGKPAAKISSAAKEMQKATKIADVRNAFGKLSEALVAYLDAQKRKPGAGLKVAVCPMVDKPWIQKDGPIQNPYYGSEMLGLRQLQEVNLPFTKHTLGNGLDVLLHEDHACPIVAVNVWYHVGSKNERPGHTGFAHLFEHLMFEGSQHHDRGFFQPLQGAGATLNGSTNADRTNYWEVVPTSALELALWMESDRMGYLLPALTEAKFSNQRDVVLNERRQNYENRPYGLAPMAMLAALFPPDHPYHWTTIGEIADLQGGRPRRSAARSSAATIIRRNASIALAGDIDPDRALALVARYFGEIAPAPTVEPVRRRARRCRATCASCSRIASSCRGCISRGCRRRCSREGDADLDLAADLLANGKTSRLYRRLVFDERIATDVSAAQNSREMAGFVQITATAAPGHTLGEIERVILEEIARLVDRRPDRGRDRARPRPGRSRSSCSGCRRSAVSAASPIS